MPTRRIRFRTFDKGLFVSPAADQLPEGALRRARGVAAVRTGSIKSRFGSTQVLTAPATVHTVFRFGDVRFAGVGGLLQRNGVTILTGLTSSPFRFARMPPTTGITDYLFLANGGLARKINTAGAVTTWGIAAPTTAITAAKAAADDKQIEALDVTTGWTVNAASGGSIALDSTIKQEGTNALKITVPDSGANAATKIAKTLGATINLNTLDSGATSPPEDYIAFWMRVDNVRRIESVKIMLTDDTTSSNGTSDSNNALVRELVIDDHIRRRQILRPIGIGDLAGVNGQEATFLASNIRNQNKIDIVEQLGETFGSPIDDGWVRFLIPKTSFTTVGSMSFANVRTIRFIFRNPRSGDATVYLDDIRLIGGTGMQGDYQYRVTFRNSTTGTRSNPSPITSISTVFRQAVELSDIPVSTDTQVNQREIWRTVGNGAAFFKAATISDNVTTTFTDSAADFSGLHSSTSNLLDGSEELPLDNTPPADTTTDVVFNAGRAFTLDSANPGRVNISPAARTEAITTFVDLTDTDDPLQRLVVWRGAVYALSEAKLFVIEGTDIFIGREVFPAAPGTVAPDTVVATPFGIVYEAHDGVRVYTGGASELVAYEPVARLFRGENAENLTAFQGITAAFGLDEYLIGDGTQALGLNLSTLRWRDIGLALNAVHYEADTGKFLCGIGNRIRTFEDEGVFTDAGSGIPFEVQIPTVLTDVAQRGLVQFVHLDANFNDQLLTVTHVFDDTTTVTMGTFTNTTRGRIEIPQLQNQNLIAVRISGTIIQPVEVFGVETDVYLAEAVQAVA